MNVSSTTLRTMTFAIPASDIRFAQSLAKKMGWATVRGKSKSTDITPELLVGIEKGREQIRRGECVTVSSEEELDKFLAEL